jgi:hypothetical protein
MSEELHKAGRKVVVVVASDGEATDGELSMKLNSLKNLPCGVVVRLCTDEERIQKYWRNIDENVEIELDILDDLAGEGREVHAHNAWLSYPEQLHRAREWGSAPQLLDLLDERKFGANEAAQLVSVLLGSEVTSKFPNHQVDPDGYLSSLDDVLKAEPQLSVFDADYNKKMPWIDVPMLAEMVFDRKFPL